MRVVSALLKRIVYPSLGRAGIFRRTAAKGLAVLTYHGILPHGYQIIDPAFDGNLIAAEIFRRQLRLLKKHYIMVTPEDVLAWCEGRSVLPAKSVLLTCDDGLLNNLTEMLPVLQEENIKCLFFVTAASANESRTTLWHEDLFRIFFRAPSGHFQISHENVTISLNLGEIAGRRTQWWSAVNRLSRETAETRQLFVRTTRQALAAAEPSEEAVAGSVQERRFGLMMRSELPQLLAAGMTIGAHSLSHPMLSQCPEEIAWEEISESRTRLESALQTRVWSMAYPFGDPGSVSPRILRMAKDAGYKAAFMNYGGGLGVALPPHALPRIHVTAEMGLAEFDANVAGFPAALHRHAHRSVAFQPARQA